MSITRDCNYRGPDSALTYSQYYGDEHARVVDDQSPDAAFYSKISNAAKVDFICRAVGLHKRAFYVDVPFPIEDWAQSGEQGLIMSGLYLADLRRQFYGRLLREKIVPESSPAWLAHGKAEFWSYAFNHALARKNSGEFPIDTRVLN